LRSSKNLLIEKTSALRQGKGACFNISYAKIISWKGNLRQAPDLFF